MNDKTPSPEGALVEREGGRLKRKISFSLPSIPSALEFRREAYGWTQSEMAEAIGTYKSHYSEIVNGKRKLTYAMACRAYEIGVPYTVLLARKNQRAVKAKYMPLTPAPPRHKGG